MLVGQVDKRKNNFARWWTKNHHRSKAHVWLAYHARTFGFAYALPPEAFNEVQKITKRFFASDHRRLNKKSAWFLWKITHPLSNERNQRMLATAEYLKIQKEEFKQAKYELKQEKEK